MFSIKKLFEPTDMTVGTPWKKIAMFALPMLIGNIAQQLYSTVDSIVVGRYVGDNALAAVGSAVPLFNLLLVLFVGISAGVGIMVYFNRLKMQRAAELIKEGFSVKEAALSVGFSDQNYFSTVFKRITGRPPTKAKTLH